MTEPYPKYILRNIIISGTSVAGGGNLPTGGSTGQYLRKISSTDFDTEWGTLTVANVTDLTASATELNYTDGVTSSIQAQLDAKLGTSLTSANIIVGNGSNVATAVAMTGDIAITNTGVTSIGSGVIVNADVNASAAIAVSKLAAVTASRALVSDGSGFISAATTTATEIGYVNGVTSAIQTQLNTKLTNTLTSANVFVGNGSNVATGVAISGDVTISNAGVVAIAGGVIVNADVNASAAIAVSKLAAVTASRALASDASGFITPSATTSTELGYVSGVTSAIQDQLDDLIATQPVNSVVQAPTSGEDGYAITWDDSAGEYTLTDPIIQGLTAGGDAGELLVKLSGTNYDADWRLLVLTDVSDVTASVAEVNILDGATLTTIELNYVAGVTSNIQTQLDTKQSSSLPQNAIWVGNGSNVATAVSGGTNGYVLTSVSGVPTWQPATGGIAGLTTNRVPYVTSSTTLGDDSAFTWDATNNALSVGGARIFYDAASVGNLFIGETAGNFTTAGSGSSYNIGVGRNAGVALTTGSQNTFVGASAGQAMTNGSNNTFIGQSSGLLATGGQNIAIGTEAGDNLTSGSNNIIIGTSIDVPSATTSNQLVIQNIIYGSANSGTGTTISTGSIGIGTSSPDRRFHIELESAATNTVTYVHRITSTSSGTPANGIGVGLEFEVETSAGNNEVGVTIEAVTTDVTGGSEDFDLVLKTMAAGATASEKLRISSAGALGIGGANYGTSGQVLTSNGSSAPSWQSLVLTASGTLSSAQILNSFSSPVELIPAPGAGNVIVPISIFLFLDYNSTTYATNVNFTFNYGSFATTTYGSFLASTADRYFINIDAINTGDDITNKNFAFAALAGNPTTGDSPIYYKILYRIVSAI